MKSVLFINRKKAIIAKKRWTMWEFYWYPDGTKNPWQTWYDAQNAAVRGRHDIVFRMLTQSPNWTRPLAEKLTDGRGLIEIIITAGVAHRLLGFYGVNKGDFTTVLTCTHKNKQYKPKKAFETAKKRMDEVKKSDRRAIRCEQPTRTRAVSR